MPPVVNWNIPNCSGFNSKGHCPHEQNPCYQNQTQVFMCCHCGATATVTHGPYAPANNQPPRI